MKTLQTPISASHKSAMFFDGVVAEGKGYRLETFQDGELVYKDNLYIGKEIIELGRTGCITDGDVDSELTVDIQVDKFFCITAGGVVIDDDLMFTDYDEAIEEFKDFLEK